MKFVKDTKGDANVEFLSVSTDEDWKTVDAWLKEHGISGLPVALDPRGATARLYGTTGYPETFFIGPSGEIVQHVVGPMRLELPEVSRLRGGVQPLLGRAEGQLSVSRSIGSLSSEDRALSSMRRGGRA